MPFGVVMSQDVFQQKMNMILEQCPGIIRLIDDVVVYGQTNQEHAHNLMKVARPIGLCFNSTKCAMDQKEIHFGAVFSKNDLHTDKITTLS